MAPKRPVAYEGREYESISELARELGITRQALHQRIGWGWLKGVALSKPNNGIPVKWNGVSYISIREAAKALGVKYTTMRDRVLVGYESDSDLHRGQGKSVTIDGVTYRSIREAAEKTGIHPREIYRLKK